MTKKKQKGFLSSISLDFKKTILGSILLNALFLLFGLIMYLNTTSFEKAAGIILGIYFILRGVYSLYEFFNKNSLFTFRIYMGIFAIILGFLTIAKPLALFQAVTFGFGLYLGVLGIVKVLEAIKLKKINFDGWLITLVTGALVALFGILMATGKINIDVVKLSAIFIMLSSILEIANLFMIMNKTKEIEKLLK